MNIWWAMDYDVWKDGPVGGCLYSTRLLVQGLRSRGHTVTTMNPVWPSLHPFYYQTVRTSIKFARGIEKALRTAPPDVVVAQNHVYPYVVAACRRQGVPVVIVARDERYRCPNFANNYQKGCDHRCAFCVGKMALVPYPWFRHHVNMMRRWTPEADFQIVPSPYIARDMTTWLEGTNPRVYPPPVDDSHVPESWRPRDVLFMGKGEYKGADLVVKMAKALTHREDFRFRVCGVQEPLHAMQFQALPNVDYLGFVDRKVAFERAAIHIAPARWPEPASRTVCEAQYVGIPSICSNVGGQVESMMLGGCVIEEAENIEEWVNCIEHLMDNPSVWQELSYHAKTFGDLKHIDLWARVLEDELGALL